jgi:hypothetical protein
MTYCFWVYYYEYGDDAKLSGYNNKIYESLFQVVVILLL